MTVAWFSPSSQFSAGLAQPSASVLGVSRDSSKGSREPRNPRISDLIYWPGEYFGDNSREFTPEEIIDIALSRVKGSSGPA